MGIDTVSMIGIVPRDKLIEKFGTKLGNFLSQISVGIDNSIVNVSSDVPKSISEEESFRKLTDFEDVVRQMKLLIMELIKRIEKDGRAPRTIKLSVRKHNMQNNFARVSRQANFDAKILNLGDKESIGNAILENVITLFDKMIDDRKSFDIAVINIGFTNFDESHAPNISSFFVKESSRCKPQGKASGVKNKEANKFSFDCSSTTLGCVSSSRSTAGSTENNTDERTDDVIKCEKDLISSGCPSKFKIMNENQASTDVGKNSQHRKDFGNIDSSIHISHSCRDKKTSNSQYKTSGFNMLECQESMITNTSEHQTSELESRVSIASDQREVICQGGSHMDLDLRVKSSTLENDSESFQNVSVGKNDKIVLCPAGVDSSVFRALPVDIQNELIRNWKRKEHEVLSISNKGSTPRKKQKRTFGDAKSKSILHYFPK